MPAGAGRGRAGHGSAAGKTFFAPPRGPPVPPNGPCPNCGQAEWLENEDLHYMPRVVPIGPGRYATDPGNGIHVRAWRCNNCLYVMLFWEPD